MNLTELTNEALEARLLSLRARERNLLTEILQHINEVDSRRLHLDRGFPSLFAYCVSRLGYSESAAGRRIAAARAMRRSPRLESMLRSGEISLSVASTVASHLTPENHEELLHQVRGRTQRQVAETLALRSAPEPVRERIRAVKRRAAPQEISYEYRFAASKEFREKYERVRSLMSGTGAEQVFEALMDEYLKEHDRPRKAHSRAGSETRTRHVPAEVRRAVRQRYGGKCTYEAPDGTKCGSSWDVEVHHEVPYRNGGQHTAENLRLLCASHNRRAAEQELGTKFMARYSRRE